MSAEGNERTAPRRHKTARGKEADGPVVQVRRLHRRDLNKVWEFIKKSFRDVNLETVEYQRPRSKKRFYETYEEEGVEQLLFIADGEIVAYTECTYEIIGSDTWINPRYFERRDMRPLFVEELAVHPGWHGRGVGSFVLEQIQHLAKVRGLTHLVLEVAENNTHAVAWYRKRGFRKLDASVFMAYAVDVAPELLPPRALEEKDGEAKQAVMVVPVGQAKRAGRAKTKGKTASAKRAAGNSRSAAKAKAKAAPPAAKKAVTANTTVVGSAGARPPAARPPASARPAAATTRPVTADDAAPAAARTAEAAEPADGKNGQRTSRAATAPPAPVSSPARRR